MKRYDVGDPYSGPISPAALWLAFVAGATSVGVLIGLVVL